MTVWATSTNSTPPICPSRSAPATTSADRPRPTSRSSNTATSPARSAGAPAGSSKSCSRGCPTSGSCFAPTRGATCSPTPSRRPKRPRSRRRRASSGRCTIGCSKRSRVSRGRSWWRWRARSASTGPRSSADLDAGAYRPAVHAQEISGFHSHVLSTPTFFINGGRLRGLPRSPRGTAVARAKRLAAPLHAVFRDARVRGTEHRAPPDRDRRAARDRGRPADRRGRPGRRPRPPRPPARVGRRLRGDDGAVVGAEAPPAARARGGPAQSVADDERASVPGLAHPRRRSERGRSRAAPARRRCLPHREDPRPPHRDRGACHRRSARRRGQSGDLPRERSALLAVGTSIRSATGTGRGRPRRSAPPSRSSSR